VRGARLHLKRGRGTGGALPRCTTWAQAAVAADARCGYRRKGAALPCGPGLSVAEGKGRRGGCWKAARLGWAGGTGPARCARGRPSWAGAVRREDLRAENREGEERKEFPFSFSKQIFQKHFKFKFQFSLRFLINTNIHKLICSSMYASLVANLIFDFGFIKIITFLC